MIRYITYKEINKDKWDRCIEGAHNGIIYVYSWYLDSVCDQWDALVEDDYKAVFPLPNKSKMGIHYIFQPFFSRSTGVFSKAEYTGDKVLEFLKLIPRKFQYINMGFDFYTDVKSWNFNIAHRVYQSINITAGYASICANYSDNLKRNIKKADMEGLVLKCNLEPAVLVNLFRANKGQELNIFKENDYRRLLLLMKNCVAENKGEAIGVYNKDNVLCSAAFFMYSHQRVIYLKGASSEAGRKSGAMHYLFDQYFQRGLQRGNTFDFGGSMVESIARFFKSFGGADTLYFHMTSNKLPWPLKFLKS